MMQDDPDFPPLSSKEEATTDDDPVLKKEFVNLIRMVSPDWRLGKSSFSKSERWGTVWRVDFVLEGMRDSSLINRIICWKTDAGEVKVMIAIGKNAEPIE